MRPANDRMRHVVGIGYPSTTNGCLRRRSPGPIVKRMRLWSLHPQVSRSRRNWSRSGAKPCSPRRCSRAQTKGYRNHPQLQRFRTQPSPVSAIAAYLRAVHEEATHRRYRFDAGRIAPGATAPLIAVCSQGQLDFEWRHLITKLEARAPRLGVRRWARPIRSRRIRCSGRSPAASRTGNGLNPHFSPLTRPAARAHKLIVRQ